MHTLAVWYIFSSTFAFLLTSLSWFLPFTVNLAVHIVMNLKPKIPSFKFWHENLEPSTPFSCSLGFFFNLEILNSHQHRTSHNSQFSMPSFEVSPIYCSISSLSYFNTFSFSVSLIYFISFFSLLNYFLEP